MRDLSAFRDQDIPTVLEKKIANAFYAHYGTYSQENITAAASGLSEGPSQSFFDGEKKMSSPDKAVEENAGSEKNDLA
jgi:hypothetical protein